MSNVSDTPAKFGGIFPAGGVEAGNTTNAEEDVRIIEGCRALFYSLRCADKVDPLQANAIISEIANVIKKADMDYDCKRLDNLAVAIEKIIDNKLNGTDCLPLKFLDNITESFPIVGVHTSDKDCPDGYQLSLLRKENTLLSTATPRTVYGNNPQARFIPVSSNYVYGGGQGSRDAALCYSDNLLVHDAIDDTINFDTLQQNMMTRHYFYVAKETVAIHRFFNLIPSFNNSIASTYPGQGAWPPATGDSPPPRPQPFQPHAVRYAVMINGSMVTDMSGGVGNSLLTFDTSITSAQMTVSGSIVYTLSAGYNVVETFRLPHNGSQIPFGIVKFLMYDRPAHQSVTDEISIYSSDILPRPKVVYPSADIAARRLREARNRVLDGMWTGRLPDPATVRDGTAAKFISFADKLKAEATNATPPENGGYSAEYLAMVEAERQAPAPAPDAAAKKGKI